MTASLAFLFDVDNTLIDNDAIKHDLSVRIDSAVRAGASDLYWQQYEVLRTELGHSDFLGTFQRCWELDKRNPCWLPGAALLLDYPFAERLYPGVDALLPALASHGTTAIVSDGDAVLQPRKITRSGLWKTVAGRVFIYQHKQQQLDDVATRVPARHYVFIDDKLRLLDAIKQQWGARVTTVFVRQGHYAADVNQTDGYTSDLVIACIADLLCCLARANLIATH